MLKRISQLCPAPADPPFMVASTGVMAATHVRPPSTDVSRRKAHGDWEPVFGGHALVTIQIDEPRASTARTLSCSGFCVHVAPESCVTKRSGP